MRGDAVPWWAFWRRRPRPAPPPARPAESAAGDTPVARPAATREKSRDVDGGPAPAFSGASPDAGLYELSGPPEVIDGGVGTVDAAAVAASGRFIGEVVSAVLAQDAALLARTSSRASATQTVAAAAAATAALAARLPALSGVVGPAAVPGDDESPSDLLRAYAGLLVTRCAQRRLADAAEVSREQLTQVAAVAAEVAHVLVGGAGGPVVDAEELVRRCSTDLPALTQLLAASQLLAQTAHDGSGGPGQLPDEIAEVFRPRAGGAPPPCG